MDMILGSKNCNEYWYLIALLYFLFVSGTRNITLLHLEKYEGKSQLQNILLKY